MRVQVIKVPDKVRSQSNVTCHLSLTMLILSIVSQTGALAAIEYIPIDFSQFHNRSLRTDFDREAPAGPLPLGEVTLGGIPFSIPASGNNYWSAYYAGGVNPRAIEIPIGRERVTTVHTLINTFWGIDGPASYAYVELVWRNGATLRFDLVGNDSVRDYYNNGGDWTQDINGETTMRVWSSNGERHRLDMQTFAVPVELQSAILDTIRVIDKGRDPSAGAPPYQRILLAGLTIGTAPHFRFIRGDVNRDESFDISDPIGILACLFLEPLCSYCPKAMDANDDDGVDLIDAVYLLSWKFLGSSPPPAPFPECGEDPTGDELGECESSTPCS